MSTECGDGRRVEDRRLGGVRRRFRVVANDVHDDLDDGRRLNHRCVMKRKKTERTNGGDISGRREEEPNQISRSVKRAYYYS